VLVRGAQSRELGAGPMLDWLCAHTRINDFRHDHRRSAQPENCLWRVLDAGHREDPYREAGQWINVAPNADSSLGLRAFPGAISCWMERHEYARTSAGYPNA